MNKESEILELSRACKLCLSYIEFIYIVQEFIHGERINNRGSHKATTKCMLNLFAATGHNSYAKKCCLYIQSVKELESINLPLYNQFKLANHIPMCAGSNWSGIWTHFSLKQILMKSLKGSPGIIGRRITENVINILTKTMRRQQKVFVLITFSCLWITLFFKHKAAENKHIEAEKLILG